MVPTVFKPASKKQSKMVSEAQASVTEVDTRTWFRELKDHLKDKGALSILQNRKRIFNLDETWVFICPKSAEVLGAKSHKNLYQVAVGSEKKAITEVCTYYANGTCYDPWIPYPQIRMPRDVVASVPDGFAIGRSDSRWMTSATYFEFIVNLLYRRIIEKSFSFPCW